MAWKLLWRTWTWEEENEPSTGSVVSLTTNPWDAPAQRASTSSPFPQTGGLCELGGASRAVAGHHFLCPCPSALGGWQKAPQEAQGGGRDPLESPGPRGTARARTYRHLVHRGGSAAISLVAGPVQGVLLPAGGRTQSIKTGGNRGGFGAGGSRGCAHREPAGCGGTGYREPGTPGASGRDMGTWRDLGGPEGFGGTRRDRRGAAARGGRGAVEAEGSAPLPLPPTGSDHGAAADPAGR